jgi:fibronectin type 3 domain-containing protein
MFSAPPPFSTPGRFWRLGVFVVLFALNLAGPLRAQDHTVVFSTTDPGVTRSITNWGLDTGWANYDNMHRGLIFMGTNTVNLVQVAFEVNAPLTNNDISPAQRADLTNMVNLASQTSTNARWILSCGTGAGVDASYQSGGGLVNTGNWAAAMEAWQRNYKTNFPNRTMWLAQPFNEPDYGWYSGGYGTWGQGSPQNLYDILGYLQAAPEFSGVPLGGASTLDCGAASYWYDIIASRVAVGATHNLNGSVSSYVSFIQDVLARGDIPYASEVHNLGEVIIGANYGIQGGTWWGTAELARGSFANACQGKQLGYAEDLNNFTAAAVYRGTNGAVQAFLGGDERHGVSTSYRFFSKDRDVFYNGYGPQRDYTVTNPGYAEQVVNITWGADAQPVINGRYIVVNRNSGKVMEVAGASTNNGANIQQNAYTNGLNQQWDIVPFSSAGGDVSFFAITAAHSGKAADVNNFSYADGGNVQQWDNLQGANQQWFSEYVSNGWFCIRSRWSGKYLDVSGASTANGANIFQWTGNGGLNQQWRLIPASSAYDLVAPAAPTVVTAVTNAVSVQLNWKTNSESDLASYTVLRGTNSGGPYEICARGLTNNAFTDKSANQIKPYYYVVQAVDRSLNTSTNSAQVSATPTGSSALVARYTFDGNTSDSSGNANHATVTGSPTFVAGENGSAMNLSGTNQYAMVPAGIMAGVTNFTIAAWVYWNGGNAWQRIFDFGNDATQYMFLTPSNSLGSTLRFAITTNGNGAEQILQTSPLPVGQWQHVAVTRNGSTAKLYTNGVLAASGTVTIAPASFNPALNYLGESQFAADPLFNGRLDDLYICNYALSDSAIAGLATPQPPTGLTATAGNNQVGLSWTASPGATSYNVRRATVNGGTYGTIASPTAMTYTDTTAVNGTIYYYVVSAVNPAGESTNSTQVAAMPGALSAWWKFDETSGTNAADSSGNGNNATLQSGASWTAGKANNAVSVNGTTNYVNVPAGIVSTLNDFSIATWVYVNANSAWARLFDFGTGTTTYMFLSPASGGSTVRYAITTGGAGGEQQINSASVLSPGAWHHVAVTLSGTTGTLYIDGMAAGTNSSMTLQPSALGNTTLNYIGKSQYNDPYLNAKVDDFRIYRRALNVSEISTLFSSGGSAPAAPAGLIATPSNNQVGLSWTVSSGATNYNVKRATTDGGPYTTITNVITTSFTNTALVNGMRYYYVVSAANITGESLNSTQVGATPSLTTPVSLSMSLSGGALNFYWLSDHLGWRLQIQTNSLNAGLGTNWVDVSGSSLTNDVALPVDATKGSVFYRLIFP